MQRWGWLTVSGSSTRGGGDGGALAGSTAFTVVAVLTALSAPSFQPIQMSVLYGYRSGVVVAVRWGDPGPAGSRGGGAGPLGRSSAASVSARGNPIELGDGEWVVDRGLMPGRRP